MGRPRTGWGLRKRPGERFWTMRYVDDDGKQHELSTGAEGKDEAAREAARLWRELGLKGPDAAGAHWAAAVAVGSALGPLAAHWLSTLEAVLDTETLKTYAGYMQRYAAAFPRVEDVTPAAAQAYATARLAQVKAATVRKELSALRSFTTWCAASPPHGPAVLSAAPVIPSIPKRVQGTAHPQGVREAQWWSHAEVMRLLKALPERGKGGHRVRAPLAVAYFTSLRPGTIAALSVPRHYRPGDRVLRIPAKDDKGRFEREVELDRAARLLLYWCCPPAPGVIFGRHDYRAVLKNAAQTALGAEGEFAQLYNLRRARITHVLDVTGNARIAQRVAGHTRLSTTERYAERLRGAANMRDAHAELRAAERLTRKSP